MGPAEPQKQATTHINVPAREYPGQRANKERSGWRQEKKEISNLTTKRSDVPKVGALEPIDPPERDRLRSRATIDGYQYIELPAKVVWTIKPDNSNAGLWHAATKPRISTGELPQRTWTPQCFASRSFGGRHHPTTKIAPLDITAAFLNAELPPGRVVVLRPPSSLYWLGLIPQGSCWKVHRAIYGLREAPNLWQDERPSEMTKVRIRVQCEEARVVVSQVHLSLCMIVKECDLIKDPNIIKFGIEKRVEPHKKSCHGQDLC